MCFWFSIVAFVHICDCVAIDIVPIVVPTHCSFLFGLAIDWNACNKDAVLKLYIE